MTISTELHRRAAAARRLPGGDPWPASTSGELDISTHQLEAWSAAANHIAADGLCPVLPREIVQLLWQRGGADRELAEQINERGAAA
ncbi:hypothetical protein [Nocardia sp. NRRL WC-3656]|uniref:hypothetical protein n=1 Tax=Nocardia sp. NRRL WC-3656 TaxID=1463824 RepID=UPI00068C2AF1|nr:hypothetical protein [Nocardia sp. NRRL WC-3656]